MKILAIDTSGPICSAAVARDGQVLAEMRLDMGRTHSTQLMPVIEAVLSLSDTSLSDLNYLAVTVGPGSFTGIRIGIAMAQGLAVASGLKILPLSALAVMAESYRPLGLPVLPMIDARHARAFAGLWLADEILIAESLSTLEDCAGRIIGMDSSLRPTSIIVSGDATTTARELPAFHDRLIESGIRLHYTVDRAPLGGEAARMASRLLQAEADLAVDAAELTPSYLSLTAAEKQLGIEV